MNMVYNEYIFNAKFRKYVDEFCYKNGYTVEDALKDEEVRKEFWRYTDL